MAATHLPLSREIFENGLSWEGYLSTMKNYAETSRRLYERARIEPEALERFAQIAGRNGGVLSLSAMTEEWCGDSAVVLPIIARLAERLPAVQFRVLVGSSVPEVRDAYREQGFASIPLLSIFDASWKEIGRWMERPKSAHLRVKEWVASHPRVGELSGSKDPAARAELKELFRGLVGEMAEWYASGLWNETLEEIEALLA